MKKPKLYRTESRVGPVGGPMVTECWSPKRCKCKDIGERQCNGFHGHDGPHWYYNGMGWLNLFRTKRDDGKRLRGFDWAKHSIPPGHKNYVSPEKMYRKSYLRFVVWKKITNPKRRVATPLPPKEFKRIARLAKLSNKHGNLRSR